MSLRYFIGLMATVILLIILIILLVSGFGSHPIRNKPAPLYTYADSTAVAQVTIAGPITAQSTHNQVTIAVGTDQVVFEAFQGYDGQVINMQSFPNSANSYDAFLRALSTLGFTTGSNNSKNSNSQGYCPFGSRYDFQLNEYGNDIYHFWSTSCGIKTYGGDTSGTINLFQAQVPNYSQLTANLSL